MPSGFYSQGWWPPLNPPKSPNTGPRLVSPAIAPILVISAPPTGTQAEVCSLILSEGNRGSDERGCWESMPGARNDHSSQSAYYDYPFECHASLLEFGTGGMIALPV